MRVSTGIFVGLMVWGLVCSLILVLYGQVLVGVILALVVVVADTGLLLRTRRVLERD
jgi:hypothetical protein